MSKSGPRKEERIEKRECTEPKKRSHEAETKALMLLIELVSLAKNRQDYRPVLKELKETLKDASKVKRAIQKALQDID